MSGQEPPVQDPGDPLESVFNRLSRKSAPDVTLQRVFARMHARRSVTYVAGVLAAAVVLLLVALNRETPAPAPVHWDVEVVDVDSDGLLWPEVPGTHFGRAAEEMEKP